MNMVIAGIEFDHCHYDDRGDVLYLSVGPSSEPVDAYETAEGHTVEYDKDGRVIGLVLYAVRHTLDRDGELSLTWPQAHLLPVALEPVLLAA